MPDSRAFTRDILAKRLLWPTLPHTATDGDGRAEKAVPRPAPMPREKGLRVLHSQSTPQTPSSFLPVLCPPRVVAPLTTCLVSTDPQASQGRHMRPLKGAESLWKVAQISGVWVAAGK